MAGGEILRELRLGEFDALVQRSINETNRRRKLQMEHNVANGIDPQTIRKKVGDIIERARAAEAGRPYKATTPNLRGKRRRAGTSSDVPDISELPTSPSSTPPACGTRSPSSSGNCGACRRR